MADEVVGFAVGGVKHHEQEHPGDRKSARDGKPVERRLPTVRTAIRARPNGPVTILLQQRSDQGDIANVLAAGTGLPSSMKGQPCACCHHIRQPPCNAGKQRSQVHPRAQQRPALRRGEQAHRQRHQIERYQIFGIETESRNGAECQPPTLVPRSAPAAPAPSRDRAR